MMSLSPQLAIVLALALPLVGGAGILLSGRRPNLREGVTLVSALALLAVVATLVPQVLAGERPQVTLFELLPGLEIRFVVEPLGMLFATVAAFLWPVNSLYSI